MCKFNVTDRSIPCSKNDLVVYSIGDMLKSVKNTTLVSFFDAKVVFLSLKVVIMGRKIFEAQIIDFSTGEIKSIKTTTVDKFKERFSMCRTTNGVEWVKDFSGRELQMIIVLNNMENLESHMVSLTPLSREAIFNFFGITKSTFSHIINDMEEKRFLLRLSKSDILLNPSFFYKGESVHVANRIKEFNLKYDEIRNNKTEYSSK